MYNISRYTIEANNSQKIRLVALKVVLIHNTLLCMVKCSIIISKTIITYTLDKSCITKSELFSNRMTSEGHVHFRVFPIATHVASYHLTLNQHYNKNTLDHVTRGELQLSLGNTAPPN